MGINMHVYTVYGVRLPWDDAFYEAYEEIEEALMDEFGYGKPQPADRQIEAIMDGMMGEYMVLGLKLYDSGDFRYCDDMNNYQEIEEVGLFGKWFDYKEQFARLYPDHVHLLEGVQPKLINFIHYS
jgi:hypothetical protein